MLCALIYCSQTVGELQANAFGVMNQLARIMQQPALGMMGSVGPLMSPPPSMMLPPPAAGPHGGLGYMGDLGGRSGYDGKPPAKMMRLADTGTFRVFTVTFQYCKTPFIHFCQALLRVRSAKHRHHSPEWMILSHVNCFIQGEVQ